MKTQVILLRDEEMNEVIGGLSRAPTGGGNNIIVKILDRLGPIGEFLAALLFGSTTVARGGGGTTAPTAPPKAS